MVDPLIAKATQIKIASQEEKTILRIFSKDCTREILVWGKSQGDLRPDLVGAGLKVKSEAKPVRKPGRRLRAQELATTAIEKIIDPAAPPEERALRRRRLTKGTV
jgi:hypothetical protein